ncbi:MAG: DUF2075 domain-containing protein [Bacteroidales bacterium]|nr:DUF2075 domain-containing protein [Bacteroidales bacterium]
MARQSLTILDFKFPGAEQEIAATEHGTNWPVVYLIYNDKEVYVGETTSAYARYNQHTHVVERQSLKHIKIIIDNQFNKSAILDIEQNLIHLLETDAAIEESQGRHGRKLQNKNAGQSYAHDYYDRARYQEKIAKIWDRLHSIKFVHNPYTGIKNTDLFKYSPYTSLTAEQELVCRDIIRDIITKLTCDKKGMAVIKGVAGTGKSLVLINMIMTLLKSQTVHYDYDFEQDSEDDLDERYALHAELERFYVEWKQKTGYDDLKIGFVVPMSSIRATFKMVFKYAGKSTKGMRASMVIGPNEVVTDKGERDYDIVFVDESHRLKRRVAMSGTEMGAFDKCCHKLSMNPQEATHLDFLLRKSRYQVLVYDENQSIKPTDIPAARMMAQLDSHVTIRRELKSQMRCQGGGDFMQYVDDIFNLRNPKYQSFGNYDFKLYDDPNAMIDFLCRSNSKEDLCRTLAGYSWEWVSKNGGQNLDIELDGKKYFWNRSSSQWILNSEPKEIGCVHTSQGYDLNRVGVILGREIDYDPETQSIVVNRDLFFDSKVKQQTTDAQLKQFIINAYKVMLVRGIKGCYVYAYNKNLREYLKQFMPVVK